MNDGRSQVVDFESRRAETPSPPEPPPVRSRDGRSPWPWVLAAALGACAVGWVLAVQEGRELARELAVREAELSDVRARLEAHQTHLAGARERVRDLSQGLGELDAYLGNVPVPPGTPPGAPPSLGEP